MSDPSKVLAQAIGDDRRRIHKLERAASGGRRTATRSSWKPLTLGSSYSTHSVTYEEPAIAIDNDGMVHLKGLITGGNSSGVIAYVPPGMRPEKASLHMLKRNGGFGFAQVFPNGDIVFSMQNGVANGWVSLNGIKWDIEDLPAGAKMLQPVRGLALPDIVQFGMPVDGRYFRNATYGAYHTRVYSRQHLGGFIESSGTSRLGLNSAPTGGFWNPIWLIPDGHRPTWNYGMVTIGRAANSGNLCHSRSHLGRGGWSKIDHTDYPYEWFSSQATWSNREPDAYVPFTSGSGSSSYEYGGSNVHLWKDDMGRVLIAGFWEAPGGSVSTNQVITTLPIEWVPEHRPLIYGTSSNGGNTGTHLVPIHIHNRNEANPGQMVINQGSGLSWLFFLSTYWLDN